MDVEAFCSRGEAPSATQIRPGRRARRSRAHWAAFLLAGAQVAFVATLPTPAHSQTAERSHVFSIQAQPLDRALRALANQTGIQIAFGTASASGIGAPAVSGRMTTEQALARLLSQSNLGYRFTGANTVAITALTTGSTIGATAGQNELVLDRIDVTARGNAGMEPSVIEITEEDIERKQPKDLQDLYADEPGVSVGSSIPISQKVYVHGVEETNLAVTIDGGRQNNKIFHHNATNLIDPNLLKAVSIDAGVAPADAGPGALGGAIAYETKDARDLLEPGQRFGGLVKASFETNGGTFGPALAAYGIEGGFEYLGFLNYAKGGDYTAGNGQEVDGTAADLLSGLGKVAFQAESGDRFELSYERVRDDAMRPFRANIGNVGKPEPNRRYNLTRQNTVFTYTDETPEGWWDPKLVLAYGVTDLDIVEPYGSVGTTGSFNGKMENRFALDIGSITAGIDFYNDRARYRDQDYSVAERATNLGTYAQARLEPWDRTRLSFGARADHQWFKGTEGSDFDNGGFSANVSGEYDVTEWLIAKAGYSHVWGGIPLAENFIANPKWDYGSGPVPMTSDNYVVGLAAHYQGFTAEGSLFRTDIHDARTPVWKDALLKRDFQSQGFEIGVGYDWGNGIARVKYASIDATIDDHIADTYLGNYLGTPIGDIITFQIAHSFVDHGLTVGGDVQFVLEHDDTIAVEGKALPGYEVANLFVEYVPPSLPNLTLRGEINNLFDATYADRATYGQEFVGVIPLLEPGRSFRLVATTRF
jgi:hemoglobin/transferrin/lactoferrin receptor protein